MKPMFFPITEVLGGKFLDSFLLTAIAKSSAICHNLTGCIETLNIEKKRGALNAG